VRYRGDRPPGTARRHLRLLAAEQRTDLLLRGEEERRPAGTGQAGTAGKYQLRNSRETLPIAGEESPLRRREPRLLHSPPAEEKSGHLSVFRLKDPAIGGRREGLLLHARLRHGCLRHDGVSDEHRPVRNIEREPLFPDR